MTVATEAIKKTQHVPTKSKGILFHYKPYRAGRPAHLESAVVLGDGAHAHGVGVLVQDQPQPVSLPNSYLNDDGLMTISTIRTVRIRTGS